MEGEVEYLSEWPPAPQGSGAGGSSSFLVEISTPPSKRPKEAVDPAASLELEHRLTPEEMRIVHSHHSVIADVLLARWWKTVSTLAADCISDITEENILSVIRSTIGPQSQLFNISRLGKAKILLKCRIHHLNSLVSSISAQECSHLHLSMATCHKRLAVGTESNSIHSHISAALKHCKIALEVDPGNEEVLWLFKLLERQQEAEVSKEEAAKRLNEETALKRIKLSMPEPVQVERRHADGLSVKEFVEHYAMTRSPVVITGLVNHMTTQPWTLDYIKQAIGHKSAPLKCMKHGSVSWAKLEPAGDCLVSNFIESLDQVENLSYLFDWSLPVNCPDLAKELKIPKYFANDFLQRTPSGSLYRDSWPSLFIAPARITSELHIDAFGSNFWMALFEGQKRWLFFPPEDVPLLYPVFNHSTDATFEVELASPDLTLYPLLSLTHPRECVLKAGEVLFVPAGCPHRVENLTKSLAISANFVDQSNFDLVLRELRVNAILDERASQLLDRIQDSNFNSEMEDFDVTDNNSPCVQWNKFKLQSM